MVAKNGSLRSEDLRMDGSTEVDGLAGEVWCPEGWRTEGWGCKFVSQPKRTPSPLASLSPSPKILPEGVELRLRSGGCPCRLPGFKNEGSTGFSEFSEKGTSPVPAEIWAFMAIKEDDRASRPISEEIWGSNPVILGVLPVNEIFCKTRGPCVPGICELQTCRASFSKL